MTTAVTKESLAARIADLEYGPRSLKEDYTLAAYKMLLATMEAEPVAWIVEGEGFPAHITSKREYAYSYDDRQATPLYRHAQPAPVVPEKATVGEMPFLGTSEGVYVRGWNDCRAAMLNKK